MKKVNLLILFCLLINFSAFSGNEGGANGDRVSAWVTEMGYHIYEELSRRELLGNPLHADLKASQFKNALEKTSLVLVDKNNLSEIPNQYGEVKDIKFVLDKNTNAPLLLLNREVWTQLYNDKKAEYRTVFHGYLYATGLDDRKYQYSSLLELLSPATAPVAIFKKNINFDFVSPSHDGGFIGIEDYGNILRFDKNGKRLWSFVDDKHELSFRGIYPTKDGGYLAVGKQDIALALNVSQSIFYKFDDKGKVVWKQKHCLPKYSEKEHNCLGNMAFGAFEESDGNFTVLVSKGRKDYADPKQTTLLKINSSEHAKTSYTNENKELVTMKKTRNGGFLLAGYTVSKDDTKKVETHLAYLQKINADLQTEWEKTLSPGKAWDVIESSKGDIYVVGEKNIRVAHDWITEPIAYRITAKGEVVWEKSLHFTSREVEYPERQGTSGCANSVSEDDLGNIWISGGSNLTQRKHQMVYIGPKHGHEWMDKNGFVYRYSPASGKSNYKIFPGTTRLATFLTNTATLVMSGDYLFTNIFLSQF